MNTRSGGMRRRGRSIDKGGTKAMRYARALLFVPLLLLYSLLTIFKKDKTYTDREV